MNLPKGIVIPTSDVVNQFRQRLFRLIHADVNVDFCLMEAMDIATRSEDPHFLDYSIKRFLEDHHHKRVIDGVPFQYPEDREVFEDAFSELVNHLSARFKQLGIFHQGELPQQFDQLLNDDIVVRLLGT
tara:strand:- start:3670 stop:4056 length:387 start_codon:yes stop_codon:yes gene_type:complete